MSLSGEGQRRLLGQNAPDAGTLEAVRRQDPTVCPEDGPAVPSDWTYEPAEGPREVGPVCDGRPVVDENDAREGNHDGHYVVRRPANSADSSICELCAEPSGLGTDIRRLDGSSLADRRDEWNSIRAFGLISWTDTGVVLGLD